MRTDTTHNLSENRQESDEEEKKLAQMRVVLTGHIKHETDAWIMGTRDENSL